MILLVCLRLNALKFIRGLYTNSIVMSSPEDKTSDFSFGKEFFQGQV